MQNCVKGERILKVASTASITVGQWYRVFQKDPGDGSLMFALNGDAYPIVNAQKGHPDPCRFLARVVSKGTDWIRLERPVPFKVRKTLNDRAVPAGQVAGAVTGGLMML
eukprot:GHRR01036925.1.p1 GENE.GHRR01036925.1~~GHRR01036925.1.p1  ORF type:complete len:109 (-),score=20.08 GHRR01036925.1:676-1002(-)